MSDEPSRAVIRAADDSRLDAYRMVRDPQLVRRDRRFLAEGRQVVRQLLRAKRFHVESVLVTEAALAHLSADLARWRPTVPCYVTTPRVFEALGGIRFHQGCLALAARPAPELIASFCERVGGDLWVGFDGVGNPDNVGAVFRSADALGASAAVCSTNSCSPLYRKATRTSMGATLRLPFLHAREAWADVLAAVAATGRVVWALTPDGETSIDEAARIDTGPRLLVVGAEGGGVSDATRQSASRHVRIPMRSGMDSLNVAASAAVALYVLGRSHAS